MLFLICRVAILTLTEGAYCFNSKRLTGQMAMKKRHLEIMGYKVVDVSVFEINSSETVFQWLGARLQ